MGECLRSWVDMADLD